MSLPEGITHLENAGKDKYKTVIELLQIIALDGQLKNDIDSETDEVYEAYTHIIPGIIQHDMNVIPIIGKEQLKFMEQPAWHAALILENFTDHMEKIILKYIIQCRFHLLMKRLR